MFETTSRRAVILGFAGACLVLAALAYLVGVRHILEALGQANPWLLIPVVLAAVGWFLAWALALRTVLAGLDIEISVRESLVLFGATVFANNVTPFGQAGGEPVSALLISRASDSEYERALAAVVSVDTIHIIPSLLFALVGLGAYAAVTDLSDGLEMVAFALIGLAAVALVAVAVLWQRREGVRAGLARLVAALLAPLGVVVPRWTPPDAAAIDARIGSFVCSLERIADDRRRLVAAFSLSMLGWLGLICCLWLSLVALGYTDPRLLAAAFVAVPLGSVAAATPFPGGLGGMEVAFVAVLAALTTVSVGALGAAVVCYRVATHWLPTVVGGASASALGARP